MSLTVSADLIDQAQRGTITDEQFVSCIRESLPYAWSVISQLADRMATDGSQFADNQEPPPDEASRGQLLRVLASDAMRAAVERHFGVQLAFQNCHRVALFGAGAPAQLYQEFVSPRGQILNQKPGLVDC